MELLTADDDGEIVVYECPDCGSQIETPVHEDYAEEDPDPPTPPGTDDAEFEAFEPDEPA
jgi:hypothetical protein